MSSDSRAPVGDITEEVTEAEVVAAAAVEDAAATKAVATNKTNPRRKQSLISVNTWRRKYECDSMEDEKVI